MKNALIIFSLLSLFLCNLSIANAQIDTAELAVQIRNQYAQSDLPGLAAALVTADGPMFQISLGNADRDAEIPFTAS
ncbi:MAG: hypothetical protein AAFO03_29005, partial [Bacteroidota bacterium]